MLESSIIRAIAEYPGWYVLVLMIMQDVATMSYAWTPWRDLWPVFATRTAVEEVCAGAEAHVSVSYDSLQAATAIPVMKAGAQTQLSEQPTKTQSGETAPICRLTQVGSLTPFRVPLIKSNHSV